MRTYDQLVSAIAAAVPSAEEIATLTDEQIQTLRKHGNVYENRLYIHTREWKEWRAQNMRFAAVLARQLCEVQLVPARLEQLEHPPQSL